MENHGICWFDIWTWWESICVCDNVWCER